MRLLIVFVTFVLALFASSSLSQEFVPDLLCEPVLTNGWNPGPMGPLGQSFTAPQAALDAIEIQLVSNVVRNEPARYFVRVRADSIDGAIVAVSDTLTRTDLEEGITRFTFAPAAVLSPGEPYAFEVVRFDGEAGHLVWGGVDASCTGGAAILLGNAANSVDLWFRLGRTGTPVRAMTWGRVKSLYE